MDTAADINSLTGKVIGAAIEVHSRLGPGLLESVYEECLCYEFGLQRIPYERQKDLPVAYKGVKLDCGYRLDIVVAEKLIIELLSLMDGPFIQPPSPDWIKNEKTLCPL